MGEKGSNRPKFEVPIFSVRKGVVACGRERETDINIAAVTGKEGATSL